MLGKRSDQKGLWEADRSLRGQGHLLRFAGTAQLFSDDDFAEIYCPEMACRPACWPLLQTYDQVKRGAGQGCYADW